MTPAGGAQQLIYPIYAESIPNQGTMALCMWSPSKDRATVQVL